MQQTYSEKEVFSEVADILLCPYNVYVGVCVCMYIYIHTCVCMYVYIHTCVCIYVSMYVCMYVFIKQKTVH